MELLLTVMAPYRPALEPQSAPIPTWETPPSSISELRPETWTL